MPEHELKTFFDLQPDQRLKRKKVDKEGEKTHTLYHENIRTLGCY